MTISRGIDASQINRLEKAIRLDIDLYDDNNNIIANFFKGREDGYLIVNSYTYEPLKYSYTSNKEFLKNKEKKYY